MKQTIGTEHQHRVDRMSGNLRSWLQGQVVSQGRLYSASNCPDCRSNRCNRVGSKISPAHRFDLWPDVTSL